MEIKSDLRNTLCYVTSLCAVTERVVTPVRDQKMEQSLQEA